MKLGLCLQGWPVMDDLDLSWINMYPMLINNVAQVLDLVHSKRSFFQVGINLVLLQSAQNLLNMLHVILPHSVEDEDVIQIYYHKGVREGSQYIIHRPHESGWCIF
jgi:hypothetical protein